MINYNKDSQSTYTHMYDNKYDLKENIYMKK